MYSHEPDRFRGNELQSTPPGSFIFNMGGLINQKQTVQQNVIYFRFGAQIRKYCGGYYDENGQIEARLLLLLLHTGEMFMECF